MVSQVIKLDDVLNKCIKQSKKNEIIMIDSDAL